MQLPDFCWMLSGILTGVHPGMVWIGTVAELLVPTRTPPLWSLPRSSSVPTPIAATTATTPATEAARCRKIRRLPRRTTWSSVVTTGGAGSSVRVWSARRAVSSSNISRTSHFQVDVTFLVGGPQRREPTRGLALDSAGGAAERLGNLLHRQIRDEPQHQHRPLPRRHVEQLGDDLFPGPTSALRVQEDPGQNCAQVRVHRLDPYLRPTRVQLHERRLRDLLSIRPRATHGERDPPSPVEARREELGELLVPP